MYGRSAESHVLVLYTGGTIGMKTNADGVYSPQIGYLPNAIRDIPPLNDRDYVSSFLRNDGSHSPYCLPPVKDCSRRVVYSCTEYVPLLDSSDMTFDDWVRIARDIHAQYDRYDGFVVLHGTDTLAYTAAALSFLLENLGKPIVVTGAQIPVSEVRSDGRENLIGALIVAGCYDVPEVSVYFNNKLMRGNRTSKLDNSALDAFNSPNMPPLAELGISIKVNRDAIFRSPSIDKLQLHTKLNTRLSLLRIFPSMTLQSVKGCLVDVDGVVLQTYGAGNIPAHRLDILDALKDAVSRGLIILNCSQCLRGRVEGHYQTGKILFDIGVISGADMTPEAALTKMAYVLARDDWSQSKKREMLETNLRGELTSSLVAAHSLQELRIIPRLANFLRLSTIEEMKTLRDTLYQPLICAAAGAGNIELLIQLKNGGGGMNGTDYDRRSGLHVAASAGQLEACKLLLANGVSVHLRDRWDDTPLLSAIRNKHLHVIRLLLSAGANLCQPPQLLGSQLCLAASQADLDALEAWRVAGADLDAQNYDGRTALHVAYSLQLQLVIAYLEANGADRRIKDVFGNSPAPA